MHSSEEITSLVDAFAERFGRSPTVAERAPGRVDLMGSHTDYNEGMVMTMAIDRDTVVLAALLFSTAATYNTPSHESRRRLVHDRPIFRGLSEDELSRLRTLAEGFNVVIHEAAHALDSPEEFFAVASELFFEKPARLRGAYPGVYDQLSHFYDQDPAGRV